MTTEIKGVKELNVTPTIPTMTTKLYVEQIKKDER
jgi:hypothetical protein